jgi:hypothetical protein
MRFHQVEVDEDIFQFVKMHAEPLVDTFNSALRRLLLINEQAPRGSKHLSSSPKESPAKSPAALPSFSGGTPQALRQILEVACLVRGGAYTRSAATSFVAKQHNVFPQTVLDKYCRQLGLTAGQFDRLLEQADNTELQTLLKSKFPGHGDVIEQVLG